MKKPTQAVKDLIPDSWTLIRKWLGIKRTGDDIDMPEQERKVFAQLYKLSQKTLAAYAIEADGFRVNAEKAKTKHKRDLYQRKFNNVKKKFQEELTRFHNLQTIVDTHGIEIPDDEKGEEEK